MTSGRNPGKVVTARVPATTANLGPGFDCLGLALQLYNRVTMSETGGGLEVTVSGEGASQIAVDRTNLAVRSAERVFAKLGQRPAGLRVSLDNSIPVGSGLGSSAAAVLGGLLAANALMGEPLAATELLQFASEIEGHPDNVTAAFYGGLTITAWTGSALLVERVPVPEMKVVVVLPEAKLATATARAALPDRVPLADAVFNLGRLVLVVRALTGANYSLLRMAMDDRLHQPYRLPLIPGMADAFVAAQAVGAAVALSGAGPGVVAFSAGEHDVVGEAMVGAFATAGLASRRWTLAVDHEGATVFRSAARTVSQSC